MSDSGVNDRPVSHESEDKLPKASPGARLAALREERGWTVEQVASQLNLAPRQVLAIERDDYPALPGMAIVRGFIRAYAKLLKVDATPLLADLGGETVLVHDSLAPHKSLSAPFAESRMPSMTERPGLSSRWVVGSLLLMLLAVGIWAARQGATPAVAPAPVTSTSTEKDSGEGIADSSEQSQEVKSEPSASAPAAADGSSPAAVVPEPAAPVTPQGLTTPAPAIASVQAAVPDASAAGKDTLQLSVREESWIEIRRTGDSRIVLSRLLKPGETQSVQITEPVSVVIGNAGGVDATLRGVPMELKASAKNNVTRLTLK